MKALLELILTPIESGLLYALVLLVGVPLYAITIRRASQRTAKSRP